MLLSNDTRKSKSARVRSDPKVVAVDLFCGVGGKTHGFLNAGIKVVAGYDIDASCQYAYETNNKGTLFIQKAVEAITADELEKLYPKGATKVLIGCAPCQPFSTYSYRYGAAANLDKAVDDRWALLSSFQGLIKDVRPTIVSAENVPQLARLKHQVYLDFIEQLKSMDYFVTEIIVRCSDYGVPQTRERLVVLASLLGPIEMLPPTHSLGEHVTVFDSIGHLPPLKAGETASVDRLHTSSRLSALNLSRVKATPQGGGWNDWPEELKLECHKRESGVTYPSVYGRMDWNSLAPTITTQCFGLGNGRFGHPVQDRAISLREAALLQTFPENYAFVSSDEKVTFKNIGRHIGNAVPVKLAEVIAQSILQHLQLSGQRANFRPDIRSHPHKVQMPA